MKLVRGVSLFLFFLFSVTLPLFYLNCGKGFQVNKNNLSSNSNDPFNNPSGSLVNFGPGKQISQCFPSQSSGYTGCIFFKNPTFQAGKVLNPPVAVNAGTFETAKTAVVGLNNLDQYMNYAVKTPLSGIDNNDFIFERYVYGKDDAYPPASDISPTNGQYRFSTKGPSLINLSEFTMYYWLNSYLLKINYQSGAPGYASGKKITAAPHFYYFRPSQGSPYELFNNAAWAGREDNIMVFGLSYSKGKDSSGNDLYTPAALSGEVMAHEFGHAQLEYGANIPVESTINDISCGSGGLNTCSKTVNGSLFAIHEAVADVYAYLMFDDTVIGEDFMNDLSGGGHCKNPRSMKAIKALKLKAQSFYDDCSSYQMSGEVHAMGSVYSTIWYGIIESARATNSADYKDAILLFYEHQKYISENDTILTAKQVVIDVDQDLFEGKFANSINSEYKSMGY